MHPTEMEVASIYALWKEYFGFDDGGWIDDYFERNFRREFCYIIKQGNELIATLCAHPHTMMLDGKQIPIRFIIGVITKKEYQHQGYMHTLLETLFQNTQDTTGLYILQAYHPEIYTSSGFTMRYIASIYQLEHTVSPTLCSTDIVEPSSLLQVSNAFLMQYDGYIKRDIAWFENLLIETGKQDYQSFGVMENGLLVGYCIGRMQADVFLIEELQYLHETACDNLLAYAKKMHPCVQVVSFIPLKNANIVDEQIALLVRLGNKSLLKNILQRDVHSLQDVYDSIQLPLYHYGYW